MTTRTRKATMTLRVIEVDTELVRRARHLALDRGLSLRKLVLQALEEYMDRAGANGERKAKGKARH
jgi:hypothetical protein